MSFALVLCLVAAAPQAQQTEPSQPPPPPAYEERVDVVAVTPVHGVGISKLKLPANIQVFTAGRLDASAALDTPSFLAERASSVQTGDPHGSTFQPDLLFRGFVGSPLLGASEGLAVYQDGVRLNEPFGDTINWDALPAGAIASINLIPGSNPLFGLNTLGGALSIRTKDGFSAPDRRVFATTGAFGRHRFDAEIGGHGRSLGYFVAGSLTTESGWRDHSPSTVRRVFADAAWRGRESGVNVSVTGASNDLTGNGTAPAGLLQQDRTAVFTYPDRTDNDLILLTVKGHKRASAGALLDGVAYFRHSRIGTFNGDGADLDDEEEEGGEAVLPFDAVNNRSHTRGRSAGLTGQLTSTARALGRENHFVAGAGLDAASTAFDFSAEWARLTADRGTIGSGLFDDEAAVDLRTRVSTASAFVTNTWSAARDVDITASARVNWTSVALRDQLGTALNGDHSFVRLNPAVGATYRVSSALGLYGSYAQSSRVPTPVELTCADPEDPCRLPNAFVSDPPLNQIVARTWEAGARGGTGGVSWTLAAFTAASTDDIIFVSSGRLRGEGHFENVAHTRRSGLEASVDYARPGRLSAFGTYSFQRATFGADLHMASPFHPMAEDAEIFVPSGSRLPGVPAHSVKLGVTAPLTRGLQLGAAIRAQSGQRLRGDEANLLAPLPAFAVVNAHARQRITSRVAVVAQLQNVLDADYSTFGALGDAELLGEAFEDDPRFESPGAPRGGWVGVEVRF